MTAMIMADGGDSPAEAYAVGTLVRQVSLLRRFVPASAFDKSLRKQNELPV